MVETHSREMLLLSRNNWTRKINLKKIGEKIFFITGVLFGFHPSFNPTRWGLTWLTIWGVSTISRIKKTSTMKNVCQQFRRGLLLASHVRTLIFFFTSAIKRIPKRNEKFNSDRLVTTVTKWFYLQSERHYYRFKTIEKDFWDRAKSDRDAICKQSMPFVTVDGTS